MFPHWVASDSPCCAAMFLSSERRAGDTIVAYNPSPALTTTLFRLHRLDRRETSGGLHCQVLRLPREDAKQRVRRWARLFSQNLPYLLEVVQVVTGDLQRQVADGHRTALSVNAVALPLFRRELREHSQVGLAQQPKQHQRLLGPARWVITQLVPQLLIVARQRAAVVL